MHQPAASPHIRVPRVVRERRWWLLPLTLWLSGCLLYYSSHVRDLQAHSEQIAIEGARNMFRMVVLTRNWNASHGGVYVPVTSRTPPNPHLDHPKRDLVAQDGTVLTMINPAYMTRLIAEMAEASNGAQFRLTSLKPIRPENQADAWETAALKGFEQGVLETWGIEHQEAGPRLRYMAPLTVKQACLACHARQGYQLGDVRGGISVSQDYAPIAAAVAHQRVEMGVVTLAICAGVAMLGWFLLEMLRRRWLELAGKVAELEAAHVQLLQSEKLASIGQLAAGVAHEINNPVGFVKSNLNALQRYAQQMQALLDTGRARPLGEADYAAADYDYLKDDLRALIDESQDGLVRVQKIVADLKDFSRVDQAERADADLNAGIKSTLNVVWNELKYKAEVVRDFAELPPVNCVQAQINQVVMNLLVNAAQAIPERGTITVRTRLEGDFVRIEVCDSGCGIAPEHLGRIFDPFFTTKAVGKGTGLGLSLSYDIVQKHGGRIEVESQVGAGTCFRVFLPCVAPA